MEPTIDDTSLVNLAKESRDLKMEDVIPSIQIGLMGILAVYGFVMMFYRLFGASSPVGGYEIFNFISPSPPK